MLSLLLSDNLLMELEDKTDTEDALLLAELEIFLAEAELDDKFLAGEQRDDVFRTEIGLSVRAKEKEAVFWRRAFLC